MATSFRTAAFGGIGVIGMSLCILCLLGEPADAHGPMGSFGGSFGGLYGHGGMNLSRPMTGFPHVSLPNPFPHPHPYPPYPHPHPYPPYPNPYHHVHPYPYYPYPYYPYPYYPYPYPGYNPDIYNSGNQYAGTYYDPVTGKIVNNTKQTEVKASAADPNRGHIDPGSLRPVDRWIADPAGGWIHEFGTYWTSYGVPHKDVHQVHSNTRYGSNVVDRHDDHIVAAPNPEAGKAGAAKKAEPPRNLAPSRALFNKLDANGDGNLTHDEFHSGFPKFQSTH